jgi:hypothetical protein
MRERFLLVVVGILIGVVVMQWTMPEGRAEYVTQEDGIVAAAMSRSNRLGQTRCEVQVLDETGRVWQFGIGENAEEPLQCWADMGQSLPTSVANIKFWCQDVLVTRQNEVWVRGDCDYVGAGGWVNCGAWPGGTVATEESTWGRIKSTFRKENK